MSRRLAAFDILNIRQSDVCPEDLVQTSALAVAPVNPSQIAPPARAPPYPRFRRSAVQPH